MRNAFLIIALCALATLLFNFWWADPWHEDVTTQAVQQNACTGTDQCFEFKADFIPHNIDDDGLTHHPYRYVWYFSDGTYESGFRTISGTGNTGSLATSNNFSANSLVAAQLLLVPTYDDKDKPKTFSIPGPPQGTNPPVTPKNVTSNDTMSIFDPVDPRRGDTITYVLKYGNPHPLDVKGYGKFRFNKDAVQIKSAHTFFGEVLSGANNAIQDANSTTGELRFDYSGNSMSQNEYRNIFIELFFPEEADVSIENIDFTIELFAQGENDFNHTYTNTLTYELAESNKPHDPNYIVSNIASICPHPSPDHLIYTIVFQNIGAGSCDSVTVKEILPVNFKLNPNEIVMISPKNIPFDINTKTREITWKLSKKNGFLKPEIGGLLRGASESPKYFTEDDTRDSVVFEVTFDKNVPLIPCSAIPNRAEIIFEDLEPIVTNDYIATIKCTNCDSCTTTPGIEVLPAVKMKKGKAVTLQLPKNKTQFATHYTWYPPLDLNDPNSATPQASPDKNTVYTAIASGGCRQEIFQVPVVVQAKVKCECKGFWHCLLRCKWWILLIILALIAWLLLRRRRVEA